MLRSALILSVASLLACGRPALRGDADETRGATSEDDDSASTLSTGATSSQPNPTSNTGVDDGWDEGDADDEVGEVDEGDPTSGDLPNGTGCDYDDQCESGYCFVFPVLGGICGDCNVDTDCPAGGCTNANALAGQGAVCNDGGLGDGCDSSEVCQSGLTCELVLDVAGIVEAHTCSQCGSDADCPDGGLCSPNYAPAALSGSMTCGPPSGRPNGAGCTYWTSGDVACASGHCEQVDVMGLLSVGICSECEQDSDCGPGATCIGSVFDIEQDLTIAGYCDF